MKIVDFSKYETDAHSYAGSDDKRSIYMEKIIGATLSF